MPPDRGDPGREGRRGRRPARAAGSPGAGEGEPRMACGPAPAAPLLEVAEPDLVPWVRHRGPTIIGTGTRCKARPAVGSSLATGVACLSLDREPRGPFP